MKNKKVVNSIVCFLWKPTNTGIIMSHANKHTAESVNMLYNMINRNVTLPFNFVCVTDDSTGINKNIKTIKLWDKYKHLGGCFNRLYTFSPDMYDLFGERFMCIDLDCVILKNIDSLLMRQEDFLILRYPKEKSKTKKQHYCGGLYIMDAGCRSQVWDTLSDASLDIVKNRTAKGEVVGSDQAWISTVLGDKEQTIGDDDGVYVYHYIDRKNPPKNTKIIFFVGYRSPKTESKIHKYIKNSWK